MIHVPLALASSVPPVDVRLCNVSILTCVSWNPNVIGEPQTNMCKRISVHVCRLEGLLTSSSTWLVVYEPIKQTQVDQGSRSPSALGFPFTVQDMFTIALKVIAGRLCSPRIKLTLVSRPTFSMLLVPSSREVFQYSLRHKCDVNGIKVHFIENQFFSRQHYCNVTYFFLYPGARTRQTSKMFLYFQTLSHTESWLRIEHFISSLSFHNVFY